MIYYRQYTVVQVANKFWMFVVVVLNVQRPKINRVETIGTGMDDVPQDFIAEVILAEPQMKFTPKEDFVPK